MRVAVASPQLRVADVAYNVERMDDALRRAAAQGVQLAVFPELGITAYSCADLFYQELLLHRAQDALSTLAAAAARHGVAAVVGLPLAVAGRLYNCAAFLAGGEVVGIIPKIFLPTTNEFYEQRWFTAADRDLPPTVEVNGAVVPFGTDLLFRAQNMPGCVVGVEICEDLWAVEPPSGRLALAGATLQANLSASDELLGKAAYRHELVKQQSARTLAAYLYAGAGPGESTTDVVYGGHSLIAENGVVLGETERFRFTTELAVADVDVQRLVQERLRNSSFSQAAASGELRMVPFILPGSGEAPPVPLLRPLAQTPFVPADPAQRARHCSEIFAIQSTGLAKRIHHTGSKRVVVGVSGGLDSTLALLVAVRAFDVLGLDHGGIVAITMPGFGTTQRTRGNAERLAELLGVTLRVIPITESVRRHFADIGHDEALHDVTYENAQARERTQVLMDVANQLGGFVVGTGISRRRPWAG